MKLFHNYLFVVILFSVFYGTSILANESGILVHEFDMDSIRSAPSKKQPESPSVVKKNKYMNCPAVKENMLNVHLVPHTHDDVGWLKTVDQYYYGAKRHITPVGVQYILDSVVDQLQKDPKRRFIYVEIAFFKRWWDEQNDETKKTVKSLVHQGRLEFILGGWSMADEASTHYNALIDEHTLGLQFLNDTFGDSGRPKVAWQIDPFGHSRELASLFSQMGYDGLFHGRIDFEDKVKRLLTKTSEMVWKASPKNLGDDADIFTGILFNGYSPPSGFCFDVYCDDDPIMDDPKLSGYNVKEKIEKFFAFVNRQALFYKANHIILTMGNDFNYVDAHVWFKNLDKLIHYSNILQQNGSLINVIYSTPSCYLQQLHLANLTWPVKTDDFFPYAHRPHSFWTGYFTSRPTQKYFGRYSNNILQIVKQLTALAALDDSETQKSTGSLKEAIGVFQHHDAISGTAKQAVANDYAKRLASGLKNGQKVISTALNKLLPFKPQPPLSFQFCDLLNISQCSVSESNKEFTVVVYNPLVQSTVHYVILPVIGDDYLVLDEKQSIPSTILPIPDWIRAVPERHSASNNVVMFKALLPPLGFSTFYVAYDPSRRTQHRSNKPPLYRETKHITIANEFFELKFRNSDVKSCEIHDKKSQKSFPFIIEFGFYIGRKGNNSKGIFQSSGAYIFRPTHQNINKFQSPLIVKTLKNAMVQEVWVKYSRWCHCVIRLFRGKQYIHTEWTVGPIPIKDGDGKEVVVRYKVPHIQNSGVFYTDSNGREIMTRRLNYRPTWNYSYQEPVASNYYPVNSRIFIQDKRKDLQLTVLTDRSEGGTSLSNGHIELMLHRRLLHDDALGVNEALNETGCDGNGLIVTGTHKVILSPIKSAPRIHRRESLSMFMAPMVSIVPDLIWSKWKKLYRTQWSAVVNYSSLPPNVHLLTLEPRNSQWLVRFEHIFEKFEDPLLSRPVTLQIQNVFHSVNINSVVELSLTANVMKRDLKQLKWRTVTGTNKKRPDGVVTESLSSFNVTLEPMQIRTFIMTISPK